MNDSNQNILLELSNISNISISVIHVVLNILLRSCLLIKGMTLSLTLNLINFQREAAATATKMKRAATAMVAAKTSPTARRTTRRGART